jgi:hypothetical protein
MPKKKIGVVGWSIIIVLSLLFTCAVGLFAWQTWEFVNFLIPQENWLMKYLAVANFDVMSLVWLLGELILRPWLDHNTKVTMGIAGGIDFLLSTAATVIQLTVVASLRFTATTDINPILIYIAYGVIALTLVVNIIAFIIVIRVEWPYIIGEKMRPQIPSPPQGGQYLTPQYAPQTMQLAQSSQLPSFTQEQVARLLQDAQHDAWEQGRSSVQAPAHPRSLAEQIRPLQQSPLETKANQTGQANGHPK